MKLLERFFGMTGSSPGDPLSEMRQLASLLVTEIRLYNEDALEEVGGGPRLPDRLTQELVRSYRMFAKQAGESESARAVFVAEAASALAGGDERLVAATLESEVGRPEPVRPS